MQELEEDYYGILGIQESASQEEIRSAYIQLAKKLHPDRYPNDPEKRQQAQTEFAKVTRAHDVIADETRRAEYDAFRKLIKERQSLITIQGEESMRQTFTATGSHAAFTGVDKQKWAEKHIARADELLGKNRDKDAETAIKEAIRLVPTEARFHVKLAEIYMTRGWKTLALTEIQAALKNDPKNMDAKMMEMKIKAQNRGAENKQSAKKAGILDQLKGLLGGKNS